MTVRLVGVALAAAVASSCAATTAPHDYSAYRRAMPRSIMVLPPLNQSVDVEAPYSYLSTISRPLGERGYYVFPVAVIDALMKENGLPTAGEMHAVPLPRLREVVGADAVLYVIIEQWGQKYQVLASTTVVSAKARLVDTATGVTLWTGTAHATESSGGGNQGLVGMLISAAVDQIVDSVSDQANILARRANFHMVYADDDGLLLGPYHPEHATDIRGR